VLPPFDPALENSAPAKVNLHSVRGTLIEHVTGAPLGGVAIRWTLREGRKAPKGDRGELGRSLTAMDGTFLVEAHATADAAEALCRLNHRPDVSSLLIVELGGDGLAVEVGPNAQDIQIRFRERAAGPAREEWKQLADYLMSNRMVQVSDLTRELSSPSPDSPSSLWAGSARAAALRAAARPFEEMGETEILLNLDHFLDLRSLGRGDLPRAMKKFYRPGGTFVGPVLDRDIAGYLGLPPDTNLYRDYLRGVWVTSAQRMYKSQSPSVNASAALLERQLKARFHQDFRTTDDTGKPAAALLAGVLRTALTTPAAAGGFGLAAGAIPPQGSQTDSEYLAALVALSGQDPIELRNRYRLAFDRPAGETVSPIDLNVETLLGLLADTWQSPEEPFAAIPTIVQGKPLIFATFIGKAPFFLQYEEWLERQRPFYPENVYDIRRNLDTFDAGMRQKVDYHAKHPSGPYSDHFPTAVDRTESLEWLLEHVIPAIDRMRAGLAAADLQDFNKAFAELDAAQELLAKAAGVSYPLKWLRQKFDWVDPLGNWNTDTAINLVDRSKKAIKNGEQLKEFERWFHTDPGGDFDSLMKGLARARAVSYWWVHYAHQVLLPYFRATLHATLANYGAALAQLGRLTGYRVGIAETTDTPGYAYNTNLLAEFYQSSTLPYTTAVGIDGQRYIALKPLVHQGFGILTLDIRIAPFEERFFKLAQAEVMLAWADHLYRNDDPSSIRRARELFKGVLFMHGENPEIAPTYVAPPPPILLLTIIQPNPSRLSQIRRASQGLWHIEQGLNAYGYREDMVPTLRYKPLKQAADLFAGSAKSAQSDYLDYQTRFETARIEGWQANAMVKKAQAAVGIATEQIEITKVGVAKAQEQVDQIKAQIAAKQAEIADASSFFNEAKAFFGGMKDAVTGMVPLVEKVMKDDAPASAAGFEQLKGVLGKGFSGGGALKDAASANLGAGAGLAVGFGVFAYAGYTSMSSIADGHAKRAGELKALQEVALPAAQAHVRLKERDVRIAGFQKDIADADLDLAKTIQRFQQDRFLNVDLWNKLAAFANRLMRQYLDLGARCAWLAERALAFEQARQINLIRLNYYPAAMRGLTGPDRLLIDLAELEATRIQGIRLTAPVKHTLSLARDFPIAFGRLKQTGFCRFHTYEALLTAAYPGIFGVRIRALTVAALDAEGPAPRGILKNIGVSTVSRSDGTPPPPLTRFADALPLSEFRLQQDLFVYGMPGETLLQFEGSGYESDWELELPLAANLGGLASLSDVLITFDMNAGYNPRSTPGPAAPVPIRHGVAVSASAFDSRGLASLRATSGAARIRFDMNQVPLRRQEKNRQVENVAVLLIGTTTKVYNAKLSAASPAVQASFQIVGGFAMSNTGPLLGTAAPLPLNALAGVPVDQAFTLDIDRTGVAEELRALFDVVLYLEYTADL
jgi:hypothetical protein